MFLLDGASSAAAATTANAGDQVWQTVGMIAIWAVILVAFYFIIIRPSKKKQKQEEELKKNLQVGQEVVTIGGIMGRVISVRDDDESFVLETSADRTRMRFKKWAISTIVTPEDEEKALKDKNEKAEKSAKEKSEKTEKDKSSKEEK